MAVYEPVKQWVYKNSSEDRHWLGPVLAGAAAGAAASLTRVPTEVIKQRLQTREFTGAISAVWGASKPNHAADCKCMCIHSAHDSRGTHAC